MNMMRMVATDLDNTLLDDSGLLTQYCAGVLSQCRQKGFPIAFVTARPLRAARIFGFLPDIYVCNNGATVEYGSESYYNPIPAGMLQTLLPRLLADPQVKYITAETGEVLYSNYSGRPWAPGWDIEYTDFSSIPANICKLSIECRDADILQRMPDGYPMLHLYADSNSHWKHIMHRDSTKANGLRRAARMLGIGMDEVVAFGDDANDIDMLRACGLGVAVGNATRAAKAAADDICLSNINDGVARWLQTNILV